MNITNKSIVIDFIEQIWNLNLFEKIDNYISHALPYFAGIYCFDLHTNSTAEKINWIFYIANNNNTT